MHSEPPRRRRPDDSSGGGTLPLIPLVIVVILGGLLLGAVLSHIWSGKSTTVAFASPTPFATITPLPAPSTPVSTPSRKPATPAPSPSTTPSSSPAPQPSPNATPTLAVSAKPSPGATPALSPSPRPALKPRVTASPLPSPKPKPPVTPKPVATPSPKPPPAPRASERAENIVRSYLDALAQGNVGQAREYLANGDPTEAGFMRGGAHLASIHSSPAGQDVYDVNADVNTNDGEYFITFKVNTESGTAIITDHTAIKP